MILAGENILLFETIVTQLKDAVHAGEKEWLEHTQTRRAQIEKSLAEMEKYGEIVGSKGLVQLRCDFDHYYRNARELSVALIDDNGDSAARNRLIENVEQYHNAVSSGLYETRSSIYRQVHQAVESTTQRLNSLLIIGVTIGVVRFFIVLGLTFWLSLTTRRSLAELNRRMRGLAEGNTDFSKRLVKHSDDELGELVGWFNLLSEKMEQNYKKIEQLSITDKLTQLYNRTKIEQQFVDEIHQAERYGGEFSVILLDLDHFKSVNDEHGHQIGDLVLQQLAALLKSSVRETDHVGLWGGAEGGQTLAEKLRQKVEELQFPEVGHKTASFGVTTYRSGDSEESMTKRADIHLYRAKEQGRNRVVGDNV